MFDDIIYNLRKAWREIKEIFRKPGTCHNCGYDLRGTPGKPAYPDQSYYRWVICSECGYDNFVGKQSKEY